MVGVGIFHVVLVVNHGMNRRVLKSFVGKIMFGFFHEIRPFGGDNFPLKDAVDHRSKDGTVGLT